MINPDERTLFVTRSCEHEFLINPADEDVVRYSVGSRNVSIEKEYQWGPGIEEEGGDKQNSVTEFISDLL
jgi:hypothetical protein